MYSLYAAFICMYVHCIWYCKKCKFCLWPSLKCAYLQRQCNVLDAWVCITDVCANIILFFNDVYLWWSEHWCSKQLFYPWKSKQPIYQPTMVTIPTPSSLSLTTVAINHQLYPWQLSAAYPWQLLLSTNNGIHDNSQQPILDNCCYQPSIVSMTTLMISSLSLSTVAINSQLPIQDSCCYQATLVIATELLWFGMHVAARVYHKFV